MKILTIIGLIFGFIGAVLVFADGWRVASRFSQDGVKLGYGKEYSGYFWNICGRVGIALIGFGFLAQLIAVARQD
jgi:hypothetical protein